MLATLKSRSEEHALRLLAQLADGSLHERDRRTVESYLTSSPEAQRRLERQRRVATALRTGGPELPAGLGQSFLAEPRPIAPATRLPGLAWAVVAAGVLVAAIAGISLLRAGSDRPSTTIAQTALLAFRPATTSAPKPNPRDRGVLEGQFAGVSFPNYVAQFGARATGQRTDVTSGRTVQTVYYTIPSGARVSYSIVSGPALSAPAPKKQVLVGGTRLRTYQQGRLSVVALVRHGRTCVLAGAVPARLVVALARAPLVRARRA